MRTETTPPVCDPGTYIPENQSKCHDSNSLFYNEGQENPISSSPIEQPNSVLIRWFADSFKEKMSRFSAVFRDEPLPAVDRAVWWLEHVMHHGARHLRSAALDLHWTQLLLLDVALAVAAAISITAILFIFGVKNLARTWKYISAKKKVA